MFLREGFRRMATWSRSARILDGFASAWCVETEKSNILRQSNRNELYRPDGLSKQTGSPYSRDHKPQALPTHRIIRNRELSRMKRGTLFVVSAPSGAGKTSLVRELRARVAGFTVSVSHTTRAQRPGEQHGQDYFFIERAEFERMVADSAFLEYARVFDNYYGTARETVATALAEGKDVMLEIDWQGARQIKAQIPACLSIFVLPPSRQTLAQRLHGRGQDDSETIARRMRDAISEMSHYAEYDYLIVNDDFETALEEMCSIVIASRLKTERQAETLGRLIHSLLE